MYLLAGKDQEVLRKGEQDPRLLAVMSWLFGPMWPPQTLLAILAAEKLPCHQPFPRAPSKPGTR